MVDAIFDTGSRGSEEMVMWVRGRQVDITCYLALLDKMDPPHRLHFGYGRNSAYMQSGDVLLV